jgi:hypothetical protein
VRRERARKTKTTVWINDGDQLKEVTVEDERAENEHGAIPSATCGCGFCV